MICLIIKPYEIKNTLDYAKLLHIYGKFTKFLFFSSEYVVNNNQNPRSQDPSSETLTKTPLDIKLMYDDTK